MLSDKLFPIIEPTINDWAKKLSEKGISPNQLTIAGCVLSLLGGILFAKGYFFFGALVLSFAGICDLLDGTMARIQNQDSAFGAFFDSTIDRYSDFFIFSGIAVYFLSNNNPLWGIIAVGVLLGAIITSYTKARAEMIIEKCDIGFFARPERYLFILVGSFLPFLLKPILFVLLIGTHTTAIQRIFYAYRETSKKEMAREEKSEETEN